MPDDLDNDLLQDDAAPDSPVEAPEEVASKPAHSPLALHVAAELGIDGAEDMTPESLNTAVLAVRKQQQKANAPKPVVEEEEADAPLDYGQTDDGRPITNDAEYAAEWGKANLRALKLAHQADVRATKAEKRNAKLEETFTQEQQRRQQARVIRDVHEIMATRPDLYGENPGKAKPGSKEANTYRLTMLHLQSLGQNAKGPAVDMPEAMELFGPAPEGKRGHLLSVRDVANSQLARPSARRAATGQSIRDQRIAAKADELEQANIANGYPSGGDDDDLL